VKSSRAVLVHVLALASVLTLPTLSRAQQQKAQPIVISGSSTVYPFSQAAIKLFAPKTPKGVSFQADAQGTSAGFRSFCARNIPIAAASRPINASELKACKSNGVDFLELPIAFDAITIVVHPSNTFVKEISLAQLKTLWEKKAQAKILRWNQLNPNWPASTIKLCGPGADSGTYDVFNKAVNGSETNSRQDYTASEDDNVLVKCVANTPGALGYFGYDYYQGNQTVLRALPVKGLRGTVMPSAASVQDSRYLPLSRPLFLYVNAASLRSTPAIRLFIVQTLERGIQVADKAKLIPLKDSTYRLVLNKLYRNILGSAFAGRLPIGLSVGQILERSFDQHKQPQFR
jgi:phosphate transport system substrate-binding protein